MSKKTSKDTLEDVLNTIEEEDKTRSGKLSKAEALARMDKINAKINKAYGKDTIGTANQMRDRLSRFVLPTPSPKLNAALGGGIYGGRIIEVFGENSSGKTFLCYQVIAVDMQTHHDSIWIWVETEDSYSDEDAAMVGVDTDRLYVIPLHDSGAEATIDIMEATIRQAVDNDIEVRGIVINSVAGLTPNKELTTEMSSQQMGLQARMMSKLCRKLTAYFGRNKLTTIFINQMRDKISLYGGSTTTGGRALRYFSSQRIEMRAASTTNANWDTEVFKKIDVMVRKNRLYTQGNPYRKASMYARYGYGIDPTVELGEMGITYGLIAKSGGWYSYTLKDGTLLKLNGAIKLQAEIQNNRQFYNELLEALQPHINNTTQVTADEAEQINKEETQEDALAAQEVLDHIKEDLVEVEEE